MQPGQEPIRLRLANPERLAQEAIAAGLRPPPPVDYLSWAVDNVVFSKRESPEPGPYNPERFSYFNEILAALSPDDPCRVVTLAKSAQLGGTVLANVFTAGSLAMDPGDVMYTHPTENNAERWSKMKLRPLLRNTVSLRALFPERSRDASDSVLYKERVDGQGAILISGANSPASLSQVTVARQVQDDLSKWEMNAGGDPESQADSRSRAVTFAKIFKISTPLVSPGCRITKAFEAGSQERLHVPCPHCAHMQVLEWENMRAALDEDKPERACFTCIACGCTIEEHHRKAMLAGAEWRAANPKMKALHRSFHLWSAYSFLQGWRQIALEWLKARGDPAAEQTFLNDTVGLPFKAVSEAPPWEGLRNRAADSAYDHGTVPTRALVLTLGIDCQVDRVEWQLVGWGREGYRAIVEYGVVPFHISEDRARQDLTDLLAQTWPTAEGWQLGIELAAIDGNAYTEDVWAWVRKHSASRVIMVRGRGEDGLPLLAQVKRERDRAGKPLRYSKRFFNVGTATLKMALYRNLRKTDPDERYFIDLPRGLEDEFYRQLTSERRAPVTRFGFTSYRWVKDRDQANEGLDTHIQAEAAAIRLGLRDLPAARWERFASMRMVQAVRADAPALSVPLTKSATQPAAAPPSQAPAPVAPPAPAAAVSAPPGRPPSPGGPAPQPVRSAIAALAALNRRG